MQFEVEPPKSEPRIWNAGPTIGFGIVIIITFFIAQIAVFIGFAIARIAAGFNLNLQQLIDLGTNGLVLAAASITSDIIGIVLIMAFIKLKKGTSIAEYLGFKKINKKTIAILLVCTIALLIIITLVSDIFIKSSNSQFMIDIYRTSTWPALLWIALVVFAPAFEEMFFRGFLFVGLKQSRIGPVGTIALTALLFAALHLQYDINGIFTVLLIGIVFGIARLKTGSLWSSMMMHTIWNLLELAVTALYIAGLIQ